MKNVLIGLCHTVRAFIVACALLPFWIIRGLCIIIIDAVDLMNDDWDFPWSFFNPFRTFSNVQHNLKSDEFNKLTGKRK